MHLEEPSGFIATNGARIERRRVQAERSLVHAAAVAMAMAMAMAGVSNILRLGSEIAQMLSLLLDRHIPSHSGM